MSVSEPHHHDPDAELAAERAAAAERARQERLKLVPSDETSKDQGLPDPTAETGAESLGGGYGAPRKPLTLITVSDGWKLDEETRRIGREGVAKARAELAAAEQRAKLREETPSPPAEPEEADQDPERPF